MKQSKFNGTRLRPLKQRRTPARIVARRERIAARSFRKPSA